jgi:serine/threonine protein kinase
MPLPLLTQPLQVDMWAVGVLLAYLLVGSTPFDAPRVEDILARVGRGAWGWTHPGWAAVSAPAKHLVASLLQVRGVAGGRCNHCCNYLLPCCRLITMDLAVDIDCNAVCVAC